MLFLTYWFVLFAAVVFPLYWLVRRPGVRLLLLLLACAVFHTHFAGPAGVLPIVALAVLTYFAGLSRSRPLCLGAIALCVAALVFYKYTRFLGVEVVGALAPGWKSYLTARAQAVLPGAPPLAISFFVFEFVHYLVDVTRGCPSIRNPLTFALYSVFWPSIVAGPVKRYQDFIPALHAGVRSVSGDDVMVGMLRLSLGLLKKFTADSLTAYLAWATPLFPHFDILWRWFFVALVSLRILLDFSGYSDMAIGFARMHGIRLPENFNWPYLATSLAGFWRRWHISLSTWIRDYVYIALGGSRHGLVRKTANGVLAFALCGLWHGAGWNFLVWGLYHGCGLAVNSGYRSLLGPVGRRLGEWFDSYPVAGWMGTMLFACVGWLFFFYPLPDAVRMLASLFGVT
jgi:alginate O-acetyltransferase complex protein AlgI